MTRLLLAVLFVPLLLAGCAKDEGGATPGATGPTTTACGTGKFVSGFDAIGEPICRESGSMPSMLCPSGEAVVGFDENGDPVCGPLVRPIASPGPEAMWGQPRSLKVVAIYGVRNDSASDLDTLKVVVELGAGSMPLDVDTLVFRLSDGAHVTNYPAAEGAFGATWIRGDGAERVMAPGDLVEFQLTTWRLTPGGLAPRTSVGLALIPETGDVVAADFRTPPTYGVDTVVTLR